jgi:hypothetical protein
MPSPPNPQNDIPSTFTDAPFSSLKSLTHRAIRYPNFGKDTYGTLAIYREAIELTDPWLKKADEYLHYHGLLKAATKSQLECEEKLRSGKPPWRMVFPKLMAMSWRQSLPKFGRKAKERATLKTTMEIYGLLGAIVKHAEQEVCRIERALKAKRRSRR